MEWRNGRVYVEAGDTIVILVGTITKTGTVIRAQNMQSSNVAPMEYGLEFNDDAGRYCYWQQWSDGGELISVNGESLIPVPVPVVSIVHWKGSGATDEMIMARQSYKELCQMASGRASHLSKLVYHDLKDREIAIITFADGGDMAKWQWTIEEYFPCWEWVEDMPAKTDAPVEPKVELRIGSIVRLNNKTKYPGMLLDVTEVRMWGVLAQAVVPGGLYPIRLVTGSFDFVGNFEPVQSKRNPDEWFNQIMDDVTAQSMRAASDPNFER